MSYVVPNSRFPTGPTPSFWRLKGPAWAWCLQNECSRCSCVSRESEGQAREGWAAWFPGWAEPDMFLKPLFSPVALAAHHAVLARAVCGGLATCRTLSPRAPPAGPPAGQPGTWAAAWSHCGFLFIVVIMKMFSERIALHCDVESELIC